MHYADNIYTILYRDFLLWRCRFISRTRSLIPFYLALFASYPHSHSHSLTRSLSVQPCANRVLCKFNARNMRCDGVEKIGKWNALKIRYIWKYMCIIFLAYISIEVHMGKKGKWPVVFWKCFTWRWCKYCRSLNVAQCSNRSGWTSSQPGLAVCAVRRKSTKTFYLPKLLRLQFSDYSYCFGDFSRVSIYSNGVFLFAECYSNRCLLKIVNEYIPWLLRANISTSISVRA